MGQLSPRCRGRGGSGEITPLVGLILTCGYFGFCLESEGCGHRQRKESDIWGYTHVAGQGTLTTLAALGEQWLLQGPYIPLFHVDPHRPPDRGRAVHCSDSGGYTGGSRAHEQEERASHEAPDPLWGPAALLGLPSPLSLLSQEQRLGRHSLAPGQPGYPTDRQHSRSPSHT